MADFNNEQQATEFNQLVQRRRLFGQLYDLYNTLKTRIDQIQGIVPPLPDPDPPSGGGGQVDSVVGGDGIDVDSSDPVNPEVAVLLSADAGNEAVFGTDGGVYVPPPAGGVDLVGFGIDVGDASGPILPTNTPWYSIFESGYELDGDWRMVVEPSGSCTMDIWVSNFPTTPVIGDSIAGGNAPFVSAGTNNTDDYTGWTTTSITRGQRVAFVLTANTGVRKVSLQLDAERA